MADIISTYARTAGTDAWFDFGNGDTILIRNIADPDLLLGDMLLF